MVIGNGVKDIQAAAYNVARTVALTDESMSELVHLAFADSVGKTGKTGKLLVLPVFWGNNTAAATAARHHCRQFPGGLSWLKFLAAPLHKPVIVSH